MSQDTLIQYDLEELPRPLIRLLYDFQDHFIGWMEVHQLSSPRLKRPRSMSPNIQGCSSSPSTRYSRLAG